MKKLEMLSLTRKFNLDVSVDATTFLSSNVMTGYDNVDHLHKVESGIWNLESGGICWGC